MSKTRIKAAGAILVALALVVVAVSTGFAAKSEPQATATFVEGKVMARAGATGDYKPVGKGDVLGASYTVKTDKAGRLELTLPDKSVLRIAPLSVVRLRSLLRGSGQKEAKSSFKVKAGKIWANVSKAVGEKQQFEVQTDNAVAGVRGTVFQVDFGSDQATVVRVYSGAVAVSNAPIYQRKGDTKTERVQVPGPREVTKDEWEELVAGAMQEVRVASNGIMKRTAFTEEADTANEWVEWNRARDAAMEKPVQEKSE